MTSAVDHPKLIEAHIRTLNPPFQATYAQLMTDGRIDNIVWQTLVMLVRFYQLCMNKAVAWKDIST